MFNEIGSGRLAKMRVEPEGEVQYRLTLGDQQVEINELLGKQLRIVYNGSIRCCHCQRPTKKSFNQGYCYPCFQRLAQCDRCIMSPELCHYAEGTCREPEWGEANCMQPHIVYLANSSGVKVGITRQNQVPIRWMDQGAIQAIPVMRVSSRYLSGLVEDACRAFLPDRTNWRKLLKHDVEELDLSAARDQLREQAGAAIEDIRAKHVDAQMEWLDDEPLDFSYPHQEWPEKAKTYNLDKQPLIEDRLIAIKGQYLIFENAALNIRKYTSYDVSLFVAE